MPHDFFRGRHAGVLVPLFSIPSRESWGIGEIPDIARLGPWTANAGFDFVQVLPLNEMAEGQNSPYSALSAMALDPVFIAPANVPEVRALGGEDVLDSTERDLLQRVRAARGIDYAAVRALKRRVLRLAFERFLTNEWHAQTRRAQALKAFMDQERWWLDEYTLFRAIHAREDGRYWREWDPALRDREPSALEEAREELRGERVFHAYLQWLAAEQWVRARAVSRVGIFGDFPFMVSGDSADVWSRQQDFRLDASVGTPPDAFSVTGQDWGFPVYRWTEIASGGYEWLAARARRSAELYDGYRVDHLVGFFRTFVREADGTAAFVPSAEPAQIAQGERLLTLFANAGARVIAEDLGLIPDFVRDTMARLGIAGFKVLRWEREWLSEGQPFRDPLNYPTCSVVTSSTHDTETLADWWDEASQTDRQATMAIPFLERMGCDPAAHFRPEIRDAIIELLFASASDLLLLPIQDIFGWRDRINTPALISEQNWTWRLSWPVEDLQSEPAARERAGFVRRLADRYHRRLT
jgi:4-alpha-glucanotransferase